MRKIIVLILFCYLQVVQGENNRLKVLHLTLHMGCYKEIQSIAKELNIDLENVFVHHLPKEQFDGITTGSARYNIGAKRAKNIWEVNQEYFSSFDAVITSDTVPLARTFLQHNFDKPLIIWVCNRFDYADGASLDCNFPDSAYYDLIKSIPSRPNVRILSYTPFEHIYAKNYRGIAVWSDVIKPIGDYEKSEHFQSAIPNNIDKTQTFFIPQYHNDTFLLDLEKTVRKLGVPCYRGRYNGPDDLKDFKGIIHIPYAWSNLALFENWQNGVIYFIPSKKFFLQLSQSGNFFFSPPFNFKYIQYAEWYLEEHKDLFVFFDSWKDLERKIAETDYERKREDILEFAHQHREKTLSQWRSVFHDLGLQIE
ncbi:MAG: hypothetical protein HY860_06985 [Chlamydiales bacterium]|nr:hypothetical protein [Chlamydiales bacterium]